MMLEDNEKLKILREVTKFMYNFSEEDFNEAVRDYIYYLSSNIKSALSLDFQDYVDNYKVLKG